MAPATPQTPSSPFPSPNTVQPSSLSRLTLSDKLLLAQAVHHIGTAPPDWGKVSSILLSHPLIKTKPRLEQAAKAGITLGRVFGSRECERAWVALMRQYNLVLQPGERDALLEADTEGSTLGNRAKEARGLPPKTDRASQLALAQFLYAERIRELQEQIRAKENAFKTLVSEIEALNSGSLDEKLLDELERSGLLREEEAEKENEQLEEPMLIDQESEVSTPAASQSSANRSEQNTPKKQQTAKPKPTPSPKPLKEIGGGLSTTTPSPSRPLATITEKDGEVDAGAKGLVDTGSKKPIEKVATEAETPGETESRIGIPPSGGVDRLTGGEATEGKGTDSMPGALVVGGSLDREMEVDDQDADDGLKRKHDGSVDEAQDSSDAIAQKKSKPSPAIGRVEATGSVSAADQPSIAARSTEEAQKQPSPSPAEDVSMVSLDEAEAASAGAAETVTADIVKEEGAKPDIQEAVDAEASDEERRPEPERRRSRRGGRRVSATPPIATSLPPSATAKNNRIEALRSREASGTSSDRDEERGTTEELTDAEQSRSTMDRSRTSLSPAMGRRGRGASRQSGRKSGTGRAPSAGQTSNAGMEGDEANTTTAADSDAERERAAQLAQQRKMEKVLLMLLNEVSNHTHGNLFHAPIKEADAPDYYTLIRHPLDLKTIKARIKEGRIRTATQLRRALMQMFANSLIYNRPGSEIHRMASEMRDAAEDMLDRFEQTQMSAKASRR